MNNPDEVTEALAGLRDGTMTLQDVADLFARRAWPAKPGTAISSYDDLVTATLDDYDVPPPGSFFEVSCAYVSGALSDDEYVALADAAASAGTTVWSPGRASVHRQIVQTFLNLAGETVPREGRALVIGGMPGSGKPAVLDAAGVDQDDYLSIAPSIIEGVMAERGLIPHVEGLAPLEAAPLVHLEAAELALMVAFCAMPHRYNLLWDLTMSRAVPVRGRASAMYRAGYGDVDALFADVEVEVAVASLTEEHKLGMAEYAQGIGYGARYVPPNVLRRHVRVS